MKNKKGFTLVELLAVIVILGILLLIAVPAVQNIIASSRKKAFESNAKLALENVQQLVSIETTTGSLTQCYVPICTMKLERGSMGDNCHGFITVLNSGLKIYYSNGEFKINGGTIDNLGTIKSSDDMNDTPGGAASSLQVCSFFTN